MRPCLLLPLLAALPCLAHAQGVIASQEISLANDSRYELFAGPGGQTILYRDGPSGVELSGFNARMEEVWSREPTLDRGRPNPLGAVMPPTGELTVFYTHRRDRKLFLKLHRYSERGNLSDSLTVTELDGDFTSGTYDVYADETGRFAVLSHRRDGNAFALIGIEVGSGRVLYRQILELNEDGGAFREERAPLIDRQGAFYLWSQDDNRRSRLDDHEVQIVRVNAAGGVTRAVVKLPETLVYDAEIAVDARNATIVLAGYYAVDPDEAAGALVITLPYSLEGQSTAFTAPFSPALLASVDQRGRSPEGIRDLDALDVLFRRDGTVVILGEQRKRTVRTVGGRTGYFGGALKTDYLYEDIVLCAVSPAGDMLWQEVLPKKQFSQDDGGAFSSYFLATTPRALRLVYNDEVRSGGTVSAYTLDGRGELQRRSLMNTEYQDLWLRHEAGIQADASTVVIPSERRNRLRLVRVRF